MAKKTTLQEIAVAARVSVATASRALNGTGGVSPEAAKRVRSAAAKLQARQREEFRTHTLSFLLANRSMLHPFHAHVLMGCQEFATEHHNRVLFHPFQYEVQADPADIYLALLHDRRSTVDGYIVGGMNFQNLLEALTRAKAPFSVLGNNVLGDWEPDRHDVVWMDDRNGAYELTQYLQKMGHRKIWFLGSRRFPIARIYEGYARAMEEQGLTAQSVENDSEDEREIGYLGAKSLLAKGVKVTAMIGYNDGVAHGAMEAVRSHGLVVPEQISIVGIGNRPEAEAMTPSLTTVWAFPDQVGRRLSELVLNRIRDPESQPRHVVLPTRLIERNSAVRAPA